MITSNTMTPNPKIQIYYYGDLVTGKCSSRVISNKTEIKIKVMANNLLQSQLFVILWYGQGHLLLYSIHGKNGILIWLTFS